MLKSLAQAKALSPDRSLSRGSPLMAHAQFGLSRGLAEWRYIAGPYELMIRGISEFQTRLSMSKKSNRSERKQARRRQETIRKAVFALVVIAVLSLAGFYLQQAFFRPVPKPMAGNVIDLEADMSGFNQKEIHVRVGRAVTIRLTSLDNSHHTDGGGKHQWAIDELGVNIIAEPESSNYVTFTPDKPGTYTFYCDICCGGRANPTMNGQLIVEA